MITDEKRAFKRVNCKFTVKYRLVDPGNTAAPHSGIAISENVSLGGVYLLSLDKFEIGQLMECRVVSSEVKAEGRWKARVVRCDEIREKMIITYGVAIEFIKSFKDAEKNLKKALKIK